MICDRDLDPLACFYAGALPRGKREVAGSAFLMGMMGREKAVL